MSQIINLFNQASENGFQDFTVAVHDGKFHMDEVLALYFLRKLNLIFNIIRTRKPEDIEKADLVIDVGGSFGGEFFDHHQKNFDKFHPEILDEQGNIIRPAVKFAAAGLVWDDVRPEFMATIMPNGTQDEHDFVVAQIEKYLVIPTDATDNGVSSESSLATPTLATIVGSYNSFNQSLQSSRFEAALGIVTQVVDTMISNWISQAPAYAEALQVMREQASSEVLILNKPLPWISPAVDNWQETKHFKLTIFPDVANPGTWRIQTFPGKKGEPFSQRCSAPADWKGLREGQFEDDRIIFIHAGGFIGGVRGSLEDTLDIAQKWIDNSSSD